MFNWKRRINQEGGAESPRQSMLVDPIREAELDRKLNATDQQFVAQAVKRMPEDEVSMAWRADLNSKLQALAAQSKPRRTLANFVWKPAVGLVGACALAAVIWIPRSAAPVEANPDNYVLEQEIAKAHLAAEHSTVLVGAPVILADAPASGTEDYEFVPIDLETL